MVTRLSAFLLRQLDPERAHKLALYGIKLRGMFFKNPVRVGEVTKGGIHFINPVGLAAGFDKNAEVVDGLFGLKFGFVEVGSVIMRPWRGNPGPRIFRIPENRAIVNRMGLPSHGVDVIKQRLMGRKFPGPVLVNVALTPDRVYSSIEGAKEYFQTAELVKDVADAVVLNLSCPNTTEGLSFSRPKYLKVLLEHFEKWDGPAVLLKFGPVSANNEFEEALQMVLDSKRITGLVLVNTLPVSDFEGHRGGLSGAPLFKEAVKTVDLARKVCGDDMLIIGCGGVMSKEDFNIMRSAGADVVELLTGFIYRGVDLVNEILYSL